MEKLRKDAERKAWLAKYSDYTFIQGVPWSKLKEHAMKEDYELSFWFVSFRLELLISSIRRTRTMKKNRHSSDS